MFRPSTSAITDNKKDKVLRVATVAMQCDLSPHKNRERMLDFITRIKKEQPEVDLIVFGETILGWFFNPGRTKEYHQEIAETIPGATTKQLSEIAVAENIYLSFGMTEKVAGAVFNSQVIINPTGEIIGVHRKFFMRDSTFQPGTRPVTVADVKGIRTGLVICFDIRSNKVVKALRKSKLDLIIHSMADDKDPNFFGAGFLARNFGTWYVTANRFGDEGGHFWCGHLFISNPLGKICVKGTDKEQYLFYELHFSTEQSVIKKFLQTIYRKCSLVGHILSNFTIALSYVSDASKVRRRKRREKRKLKKKKEEPNN